MNAKQKVIIDCDPGIDDALALMLALSSPGTGRTGHYRGLRKCSRENRCGKCPADSEMDGPPGYPRLFGRDKAPGNAPYEGRHGDPRGNRSWKPALSHGHRGYGPEKARWEFLASSLSEAAKTGDLISIIAIGPHDQPGPTGRTSPGVLRRTERLVSMAETTTATATVPRWRNTITGAIPTPPERSLKPLRPCPPWRKKKSR